MLEVRGRTLGEAEQIRVRERDATLRQARPVVDVQPFRLAVVQRQHVVPCRFGEEELHHLVELLGILPGEVVRLTEVFVDVVQFPGHVQQVPRLVLAEPRDAADRARHPAVVVNTLIAEHLEVLRRSSARSVNVIEGVDHAYSLDRLLSDAVELGRKIDADRFENRGSDVDHMVELIASLAPGLDPFGP